MSSAPRISFIVPVRDDAVRLQRCLTSITRNQVPSDRLELLVVDNGSRDGSVRVAREAGARVLSCPGVRVSELRNRGAAASSGEILAFIDADHEIGPGWSAQAIRDLEEPGIGAVGAPYLAPPTGTWVQRSFDAMRQRGAGRAEVEWLPSGNLAVWRHDFERLHGFDTSLETCEDFDFCRRLRETGRRILSDDRLESVHFGDPATLRTLFRVELWRGRDNLRAGLRGELTWRALPSLVIPVFDLAWLFLGLGGLAAAPDGLVLTAVAPLAFASAAALRAARMTAHRPRVRPVEALQDFAVACVYDLARALALVLRVASPCRQRVIPQGDPS
jgi:glycosyltransferase involved in cell wall biosynthesis